MNIFEKAFDNVAARAPKPNIDDYIGDNGLIYCAKCNTPKQCKIMLFEKEKTVTCLCECEKKQRDFEMEEEKRKQKQYKIKEYRKIGFADSDMQNWNFENDDRSNEKLTTAMQNYVKNFEMFKAEGKGLLMYGSVGTGKTYAAACVVNALIDKGYPCLMTNFTRLINKLQGMYEGKQKYIDSLNRYDLIVIDDLGAERSSEFMQEQVYNIIDGRYRAGLPIVITTNLSINEIKSPKQIEYTRIYDRVIEMCHPIEVNGKSRRRQNAAKTYNETQKILGM